MYIVYQSCKIFAQVKAEIVRILYKDQVKHIKKEGLWPKFPGDEDQAAASGDKGDEDLFVNTNRPNLDMPPSETSSSSEEDD